MLIGLVKWFDANKGFGVIGTPNNGDFFLMKKNLIIVSNIPNKGGVVVFSESYDSQRQRNDAINCREIGAESDWNLVSELISSRKHIVVDGGFKINLLNLTVKQFIKDRDSEELSKALVNYSKAHLEFEDFFEYSRTLQNLLLKNLESSMIVQVYPKLFEFYKKSLKSDWVFKFWRNKNSEIIFGSKGSDFEISIDILQENISHIGYKELQRILTYSYGSDFCSQFVNIKFDNIETLTSDEIKELYQLVEFETETEREKRKHQLDSLYVQKIETELTEKANQLDTIRNSDDFNNYNRLLQLIPNQFTETDKNKVTKAIHKIIAQKCSEEFKPELWLRGIIEEVPFEYISKYFLDKDTQAEKRISILINLQTDKQFELLKKYSDEYTFEKGFALIEELVKKENSLSYSFNLLKVLFDSDFWKDKKSIELIELFTNYVNTQSNDEQKYELFLKGYVKIVPQNIVLKNIHQLEKEDCKKIFKNISENKSFIKDILAKKATVDNINSLSWLYDLAIEFLDQENFNLFDENVFDTIEQSEYFKFWETGKAKIFPQNQIEEILKDKFENYAQIKKWIENNATTTEKISDFLFSFLHKQELVTDRIVFYKQLNHIKYLLQLNEFHLEQIKQIQNDFYNVILWLLDKDNSFDFELLKQKFIYFAPDEQVRIIRKMFFLKANGQFDLTIEKLDELTRFDLDLYKTNLEFNPDISVDISTDVVIKALLSYQQNNRFFVESELLTVILNDLKLDKTRRFRLSNYFEKCLGRLTAEYNWNRNGEISKVKDGDNKFYFAITFEYDPNLVEALRVFEKKSFYRYGNEYYAETHWSVPSQYETEVLNFAKEYRFFLDFEGSNYTNNIHLAEFKRTIKQKNSYGYGYKDVPNIPNGISFCEGRLANRPHSRYDKEFWWCGGQPCFSKCETIHKTEEWEKYTLLDFCEILGLNTDETNGMGDYIPKGHYYQFIALINRFNRLLDKLYCQDCNHILYPSDFGTGHFAAHTVVRFQCRNEVCSNDDEIYLNHCLNGQCNCIIDSRVSKRCDNGLFICANCGSCCSHNMLERRLSNLKLTGGYIHDNLVKCVNEKLGHLERSEYFCYKCKSEMTEISNDIFQCSDCNVKYDTTKYKFKRPHIHLRKKKTTTENNGNDNESNDDGFDFPS